MALTKKQKRFVEEYLIDLNATQAAIRAGYSSKYADREGHKLVENNRVSEAINQSMAERSKRTGISQDRVIQELARIAFVNPKNVIDTDNASVLPNATDDDTACIQSVKVKMSESENGSMCEREVRLNDKLKALELLGKHLGMFKDKIDISADMDLNITVDYGDSDNEHKDTS